MLNRAEEKFFPYSNLAMHRQHLVIYTIYDMKPIYQHCVCVYVCASAQFTVNNSRKATILVFVTGFWLKKKNKTKNLFPYVIASDSLRNIFDYVV